jgi:iron complex outermembrane recepter protein
MYWQAKGAESMIKKQRLEASNSKLAIALSVVAATVAFSPPLASAADTPPASTPIQNSSGDSLDEVVVTAQHRSESLQNVPITVEAVSGAELEQLNITNPSDLSAITPGLNITRANIGAVPFLRGIGTFTASPGNEAAVATYIDGVYRPSPGSSYYAFNNVEQIEVLNGPQGTLFGRNAAGGVINVITKDPTQAPQLSVSAGIASYATTTEGLYASGGITNNLAADFAGYFENQADPWGHNLFNNTGAYFNDEMSLRSKWVWTPTEADKVTFIAYYDRVRDDMGSASNLLPGFKSQTGLTTFGGFFDINTQFNPQADTWNRGGSIQEVHDFSWSEFTSITSYGRESAKGFITNDSCPCYIQDAAVGGEDQTYTQEFRLGNEVHSRIKWEVGAYAFWDRSAQDPFIQYGTGLGASALPGYIKYTYSRQLTRSGALFSQVTLPVIDDKTDVTLGLRYTYDWRTIQGFQANQLATVLNRASGDTQAGDPTARFALDRHLTDNVMVYASWNRGFKSGNYNLSNPTQPSTEPETLNAYEIGTKSEFFDRRLRFDASGFYDKFSNLQVQQQLVTGNFTTNAGAAVYKGFDLAITALPLPHLTMTLASEVLNAKYTQYTNASLLFATPTGNGFKQVTSNASGAWIPFAEPFSVSSTAAYDFTMFGGKAVLSGVAAFHHGFSFDVQGITRQEPYVLSNLAFTWTTPNNHWDFKVYSDNLSNTHYYAQQQASSVGVTYSAAPPRYFGGKVTFHM